MASQPGTLTLVLDKDGGDEQRLAITQAFQLSGEGRKTSPYYVHCHPSLGRQWSLSLNFRVAKGGRASGGASPSKTYQGKPGYAGLPWLEDCPLSSETRRHKPPFRPLLTCLTRVGKALQPLGIQTSPRIGGNVRGRPGDLLAQTMMRRRPSVPPRTRFPVTAHRPWPLSHCPVRLSMKISCRGCDPSSHL